MATGKRWKREELIAAMMLYRKLPFGQLHSRNPDVIALAGKLRRSPGSVAMKLCNLASLDPKLQKRGIQGLRQASRRDVEIWQEFSGYLG
jgi:hypothetical protein